MLLASIGVRQNRMNTVRLTRRRIPMTNHLASRQRRLERQRIRRLQAMVAVTLITPRLPHPCMEARIQVTRLLLPLLPPGLSQRIRTHLTNSPVEGTTLRSLLILTQRRPQIRMDASRPPKRLNTLLQGILVTMTNPIWSIAKPQLVPQQPLLATTLPRMVVVSDLGRCPTPQLTCLV
jgi:hypothetical protein